MNRETIMPNLMDTLKSQLDAMNQMYRIGYKAGLAEGRRQVYAEMVIEFKKIQETK